MQLIRWDTVPVETLGPKTVLQAVRSDKATLARFVFLKGAHVDAHKHEAEQHTCLIEGVMAIRLEGKDVTLLPGEILIIPSCVEHEVWFLEDSIVIDFFTPARYDWERGERAYLRGAGGGPATHGA